MKFDLNTQIWDEATLKILKVADPKAEIPPLNLGEMMMQLLIQGVPERQGMPPPPAEDKVRDYMSMKKVSTAIESADKLVELSVEEVANLKKLANFRVTTLAYGRLSDILDNPVASQK